MISSSEDEDATARVVLLAMTGSTVLSEVKV
jgi:hypothetical protein